MLHYIFLCSFFFLLSLSASVENPSSELEERALTSLPDAKRCEGEEGENIEDGRLDHNANKCRAPEEREHKETRQQNQEENKDKQGHIRTEDIRGEGKTANVIRNIQKETQQVAINDSTGRCGQQGHLSGSTEEMFFLERIYFYHCNLD